MTPLLKTIQEAETKLFRENYVRGHGPTPNGHHDVQEADSWIEADVEEMESFLNQSIQRTYSLAYQSGVGDTVEEVTKWRDEMCDGEGEDWYQKNYWANQLLKRLKPESDKV